MAPKVRLRHSHLGYQHRMSDVAHDGGLPMGHEPHFPHWLFRLAPAREHERLANSTVLHGYVAIHGYSVRRNRMSQFGHIRDVRPIASGIRNDRVARDVRERESSLSGGHAGTSGRSKDNGFIPSHLAECPNLGHMKSPLNLRHTATEHSRPRPHVCASRGQRRGSQRRSSSQGKMP
jgi:hypothetical protein